MAVERLGFGVDLAGAEGFEHLKNLGGGGAGRDAGKIGAVLFQQEPWAGAGLRAFGNQGRIQRPLHIRRLAAFFGEFADELAILPGADPDRLDHALGELPHVGLSGECPAGRFDAGLLARGDDGEFLFERVFGVFERAFRLSFAVELRKSGITILNGQGPERSAAGVFEVDADDPDFSSSFEAVLTALAWILSCACALQQQRKARVRSQGRKKRDMGKKG